MKKYCLEAHIEMKLIPLSILISFIYKILVKENIEKDKREVYDIHNKIPDMGSYCKRKEYSENLNLN